MLKWALIFFLISIVAAFFGFTGIAAGAASIAKFLFFLFLVLAIAVVIFAVVAGRKVLCRKLARDRAARSGNDWLMKKFS